MGFISKKNRACLVDLLLIGVNNQKAMTIAGAFHIILCHRQFIR